MHGYIPSLSRALCVENSSCTARATVRWIRVEMTQLPAPVPLLEATDVHKTFGSVAAIAGVSISLQRGECLALVGESGSGKSTLLRCFNGLVRPDKGSITRDGISVSDLLPEELRRSTGYVQQEGGLLPHWTILRNVGTVPWLLGSVDSENQGREALRTVGLDPDEYGARWPNQLSGGQRQRVALARAIAAHPDVLLLDEPFGALDAITRAELQRTFRELSDRLQLTSILVTHDLREAMLLADRVAVLHGGKVEQIAAPEILLNQPGSTYVSELFDRAGVRA